MLQKLNKLLAIIPRQQFLRYNKRDFINLIISCYEQILEFGNIMVTFITEVNEGKYNGKKGDNGDSAYKIAVQQGFVGTEQEWLDSLKANYKYYEEYDDYANIAVKSNILSVDEYGIYAQAPFNRITLDTGNTTLRISNDEGIECVANKELPIVFRSRGNTLELGMYSLLFNDNIIPTIDSFKTINGENLVGNGNINVARYDQIPQVQTSYSDAVNHYINSDGDTDSNKCALSSKNTTILQGTKGTWSEGKLLFRKGRWGDDGYSIIAIPTATTEFDGLLSKEDKAKLDSGAVGGVKDVIFNNSSLVIDGIANLKPIYDNISFQASLINVISNNLRDVAETKQDKFTSITENEYTTSISRGNIKEIFTALNLSSGGLTINTVDKKRGAREYFNLGPSINEGISLGYFADKYYGLHISSDDSDNKGNIDITAENKFFYNGEEVATTCGLTKEVFEDILAYNMTLEILGAEDDEKETELLINNILS